MSKSIKAMKLDFMLIQPYLKFKNLLLYSIIIIFALLSKQVSAAFGILFVFGMTYVSYPFAIAERNKLDVLYSTLPIKRNEVVTGRYLYVLIINVILLVIACTIALIADFTSLSGSMDIVSMLISSFTIYCFFTLSEFIQLSIFFKLGYTKAKIISFLPLLIIATVTSFAGLGFGIETIVKNVVFIVISIIILALFIFYFTYVFSCKFYKKRDF